MLISIQISRLAYHGSDFPEPMTPIIETWVGHLRQQVEDEL